MAEDIPPEETGNTAEQEYNVPSNAYIVFGHGLEPIDDTFIVPENSVIIVKAMPGERTIVGRALKLWDRVLTPSRLGIYKDPLHNTTELINDFGSLRIYKPGDVCPNFLYNLYPAREEFSVVQEGSMQFITTPLNIYGIFKLQPLSIHIHPKRLKMLPNTKLKQFISVIYNGSSFPTKTQFELKLGQAYTDATLGRALETNLLQLVFSKLGRITQKDLLEARPGIYYNFVCRNQEATGSIYQIYKNRYKNNIRGNLPMFFNAPNQTKALLGQRIAEAETKRKQLLRGTKFNRLAPNYKARRTRRNRRSRRQRKSRRAAR